MLTVPDEVRTALSLGQVPLARLVSVDSDGAELAAWESDTGILLDGSVTADRSSYVRRTGSFRIADPTGSLVPAEAGDTFAIGSWVRLERGLVVAGVRYPLPLATLVVESWRSSMGGELEVTGRDPLSLLEQPFGEPVTIAAGTRAATALRTLWAPVLDPDGGGDGWDLDDDGRTVPLRVFLEDEDRLAGGVELMAAQGLVAYADRLGLPVLRPAPDPAGADAVVVREFRPGVTSVLLDLSRTSDRHPFNRVIVDVVATDRPQIRAVAEITDETSPYHKDRIGVQTAPIVRLSEALDQAAANAVANVLLREYGLEMDRVTSSIVPDPTLDEDDVVEFEETVTATADRYRLDRVTTPVLMGAMPIEASRVVP